MPRNRQDVPRDERVAELLSISKEMLLKDGYGSTTMAAVSRRAQLAPAAVFWYFSSKDDLFAALMSRELDLSLETVAAAEPVNGLDALGRLLDHWRPLRSLYATILSRAPRSTEVSEVHRRFARECLAFSRRFPAPPGKLDVLHREVLMMLFEGCILNNKGSRWFHKMVAELESGLLLNGSSPDVEAVEETEGQ